MLDWRSYGIFMSFLRGQTLEKRKRETEEAGGVIIIIGCAVYDIYERLSPHLYIFKNDFQCG